MEIQEKKSLFSLLISKNFKLIFLRSSEMNSTRINRGGLNSSFSSLLHQRIFLSSRGARQIL